MRTRRPAVILLAALGALLALGGLVSAVMVVAGDGSTSCTVTNPLGWAVTLGAGVTIVLFGWILLGATPKDDGRMPFDARPCPTCGQDVLGEWRLCPHCGALLDTSETGQAIT